MNDITDANIWQQVLTKEEQEDLLEDKQVLINNDLPGPVRNTWSTIKDKELLIIQEKKKENASCLYTNHFIENLPSIK